MVEKTVKKTGAEVKAEAEMKESSLAGAARRVLLASVGAVVLAQEEIEDFVNRLVEKGEIAEKDGKKLVKDILERRKKETAKVEKEVDDRIESIVEKVLGRMNVPTKSDIDALSKKIGELSQKVEDLKKPS
jgi:poly(hydroxyalkanoate) granule-associated protein